MLNGAEIPFRRRHRSHVTGSLIFDRQRDEALRAAAEVGAMRVWSQGRFVPHG